MPEKKWIAFPYDAKAFRYPGKALATHWARLHRGDCEPMPDSPELQEAWRAFHCGDFRRAYDLGKGAGEGGFAVSVKAAGVYASYLETNDRRAQDLLLSASQLAEEASEQFPDAANAHYLLAFTLGRYSQRISIVEALARGLAPKIEQALQRTIRLEPQHADACIALGLYHAEIVGKLGSLAASLTYGVSAHKAIDYFKKAVKLNPDAPVGPLEYAHGLRLLDSRAHADEIDRLLRQAAKCKPADAMERLDGERAKALLSMADAHHS